MSRALVAVIADTIAIIGRGENNALSDTPSKQANKHVTRDTSQLWMQIM